MNSVSVKFAGRHVEPILDGAKRCTIRHDLDEKINPGDRLALVDADSGEMFARTRASMVVDADAEWLAGCEWVGHRNYDTTGELLQELRRYYPEVEFRPDTDLVLVEWSKLDPSTAFLGRERREEAVHRERSRRNRTPCGVSDSQKDA